MTITELIDRLELKRDEFGNLECVIGVNRSNGYSNVSVHFILILSIIIFVLYVKFDLYKENSNLKYSISYFYKFPYISNNL